MIWLKTNNEERNKLAFYIRGWFPVTVVTVE
jgi:hypothetical protein